MSNKPIKSSGVEIILPATKVLPNEYDSVANRGPELMDIRRYATTTVSARDEDGDVFHARY